MRTTGALFLARRCGCTGLVLALLFAGCRHQDVSQENPVSLPSGVSRTQLAGLPDSLLEETLYDLTLRHIETQDSFFEHDREIVSRLPSGYLDLYATRLVEETLDEGGMAQLMAGVDRRFVPDAVRAYRRFGALGHARLLGSALRLDPRLRGTAPSLDSGQDLSDLPPHALCDSLDRRLSRLHEDVPALRTAWIRHHLGRFAPF